jgi:hypothetical protein
MVLLCWISIAPLAQADVDWEVVKQIKLDAQPLDIAASADGELIFVLVPGAILVYSETEDKVTNRIPTEKDFDRITWSAKDKTLILTSTSEKTVKIIKIQTVHRVDISGLPFRGAKDAAVTVVVFSDYQ